MRRIDFFQSSLWLTFLCIASIFAFGAIGGNAQSPASSMRFAGTGVSPSLSTAYSVGRPSGVASRIPLGNPFGVETAGDTVWLTTVDDHCVWKTDPNGDRIVRVAGTGLAGYSGDGGPATEATFNWPHEVRVDESGHLFVADTRNHVIRRVDADSGIVTTLAGNGEPGFAGDGQSGSQVQFKQPHSVVLDGRGGLLVADTQNHRLRRVDLATGVVQTVSGTGQREMPVDGEDAAGAALFGPRSLAVDQDWIWIVLREGNSIWRIDRQTNTIHHVAGTGAKGYAGDGGPALQARFNGPKGIALDDRGRVLVVDTENHSVRRVDTETGTITTVLGGPEAKLSDRLKRPHGIAAHPSGGFLVADSENHRVLRGQ